MAHNLFGERFYSHREPAWHGLGKVMDTRVTAREAFRLLGEYTIHAEPLYTKAGEQVKAQAVIRDATAQAEAAQVIGVVGPDFVPVGPGETCDIYDLAVEQPVETIGAIAAGATLFISTHLPTVDVKGDEVANYLLLINPMGGHEAIQVRVTPVRVVCQNTLVAAQGISTEAYHIRHDDQAKANLHNWLQTIYKKAVAKSEMIRQAAEILANYRPTTEEAVQTLEAVYADPRPVRRTAPDEVLAKRAHTRELVRTRQEVHRETALQLWQGKGRGMDTVAAAGTAWGLYNAVAEYEDCRWAKDPQQALESAVFGARADNKVAAWSECAKLAGIGNN